MTRESHDEKMTERELAQQSASGHPKKTQPSVESELPEGMKKPMAPGEQEMGGVHKGMSGGGSDPHMGNTSMKSAVSQLEYETERGSHMAEVGGHKAHGHSGVMHKD
jgi:hypothetical protein